MGFLALLAASLLLAGPKPDAADHPTRQAGAGASATLEARVRRLIGEYDAAMATTRAAYSAATTAAERNRVVDKAPDTFEYARRLLDLARESPKSAAAFEALAWVVTSL